MDGIPAGPNGAFLFTKWMDSRTPGFELLLDESVTVPIKSARRIYMSGSRITGRRTRSKSALRNGFEWVVTTLHWPTMARAKPRG